MIVGFLFDWFVYWDSHVWHDSGEPGFGALMNEWIAGIMFGLGAGFLGIVSSKVFGK